MTATALWPEAEQAAPPAQRAGAVLIDPRDEDAYWSRFWRHEHYCRPELDYEDYAPAYCVGYTGCLQYGGCWGDAERSLLANWERIKGDSRLGLQEALAAMRAAWDRTAARCTRH